MQTSLTERLFTGCLQTRNNHVNKDMEGGAFLQLVISGG
jgi:hypothetical protein